MPKETERKFDVAESTPIPELDELPGVSRVDQPEELHLEATYFDTPDRALTKSSMTLRRRTGGHDEGWHLKLPGSGQRRSGPLVRDEVQRPLGDGDQVPSELLDLVRAQVRDRPLRPLARIQTRRLVHRLRDDQGDVLAELDDDHVTGQVNGEDQDAASWREWELELVRADDRFLKTVERRLTATGAHPSGSASKLQRTLAQLPGPTTAVRPLAMCAAAEICLDAIEERAKSLVTLDAGVRADEPDSVHQMRVATRRLRSILKTYRPLFERETIDRLREELQWIGTMLGKVRDMEVLRARFAEAIREQPAELVVGPVAQRLDDELSTAEVAARGELLKAMNGSRYFRLLDALDDLCSGPPLSTLGRTAGRGYLKKRVRHEGRRCLHLARDAERARTADDRNTALHETRKAAKRLRYAAEVGGRRRAVAKRAQRVQDDLGEHQDCVIAQSILRSVGMQVYLDGQNAFTYGRLHALEEAKKRSARKAYRRSLRRLRRAR